MLKEKLDGLIADALKHKDNARLTVLRLIKSEFVKRKRNFSEKYKRSYWNCTASISYSEWQDYISNH